MIVFICTVAWKGLTCVWRLSSGHVLDLSTARLLQGTFDILLCAEKMAKI